MGRQHQGMDRPAVRQVPEGSGKQGKMKQTCCKIICGAPTTFAVKGLMMMMSSCSPTLAIHVPECQHSTHSKYLTPRLIVEDFCLHTCKCARRERSTPKFSCDRFSDQLFLLGLHDFFLIFFFTINK